MILNIYGRCIISLLFTFIGSLIGLSLYAQIDFEIQSQYFKLNENSYYAIGFTDLNGDYHDDLILTPNGNGLNIYYQSGSNSYALRENNSFGYPSPITTLTTADLDHDNLDEILISGAYNNTYIYGHNGERYIRDTLLMEDVFAQGSNSVDIDNDGFLDFFICHDDANNLIYINDGSGNLDYDVSNLILPVDVTVDNSGNYGSEWVDFDDDGDLDLYISKCRLGVTDTLDIRRRNALYVNNGFNQYTQRAEFYGLASGWQSWVSQWGDVDNDGDLDVLVLNHDYHHQLFRNNLGTYIQDTLFAGEPISDIAIQGIMQDYDNDGDLDVLVTGSQNYMLWNDGEGYFEKKENPFGPIDAYSAAVGDFNSDGFLDVVTANGGQNDDRLYQSVINGNNFLKISLNGIVSNKEGVGASVSIYGPWGTQRRDIKSGESYGIINSNTAHFGLGQNTVVDSVIVKWPSGIKDLFFPDNLNRQYVITEGQCIQAIAKVLYDGDLSLCGGESIVLKSSYIDSNIVWSDGSIGVQEIVVDQTGTYSFRIIDPVTKCLVQSELVYVSRYPEQSPLKIVADADPVICKDLSLSLSIESYDLISWSTGDSLSSIEVYDEGWYYVEIQDTCTINQEDSIYVVKIDPVLPMVMNDSIIGPGIVQLEAIGDSLHWYATEDSGVLLSTIPDYSTYVDETTSFYVSNIGSKALPSVSLGEDTHTGQTMFSNDAINAGMQFRVNAPCSIKSIDVYSDVAGSRTIALYDFFLFEQLDSFAMFIPAGEWITIPINFKIENPGTYILTTDEDLNLQNLGHAGPRFARSFEVPLEYPYILDDVIEITSSTYGADYYYYFYNWQIEYPPFYCESDRVEVIAFVDDEVSVSELDEELVRVYPNPFSNRLKIEQGEYLFTNYTIHDIYGRKLVSEKLSDFIDLQYLNSGTYFLELRGGNTESVIHKKIVKID